MSEFPLWFPGARLNYAENLLRGDDNRVALICEGTAERDTDTQIVILVRLSSFQVRGCPVDW